MGSAALSPALREIKQLLCVQNLIINYIKQIDSMLPCICPLIDHRGRQNVVRTSVTHSVIASCATFLFLPHFDGGLYNILEATRLATFAIKASKHGGQLVDEFFISSEDIFQNDCCHLSTKNSFRARVRGSLES